MDRFWSKVDIKGDDECWNWKAHCNRDGYGYHWIKKVIWRAHRYAYTITYGVIAKGLIVCHTCDNPSCCNPKHLWLGTVADNMKDKNNKKRQAKGEQNGQSKLNSKQVLEIRSQKLSFDQYAQKFKVSSTQIRDIIKRKYWKHI